MNTPITQAQLEKWSEAFAADGMRQVAKLALSKSDLNSVAYVSEGGWSMQRKFSIDIETLPVTNQEASGRCWLFAAMNVLRERLAKALNVENFELSQSYMAFWDKFERANYFLESIISTADLPADDRIVSHILHTGVHDGGQWDMFANIAGKYGVVPKSAFGETYQSSHTGAMNHVLNRSLKKYAMVLRRMIAQGAGEAEVQEKKEQALAQIYGFLCACYGEPPKRFDLEYVDKDKQYHRQSFTPMDFYKEYGLEALVGEMVSIINAPTQDKPFGKTFTIQLLGNVVGGRGVKHLNLSMADFKAAVIRQLQAGKVVWFGSDVGKFGERDKGIWDDQCYQHSLLTGLDLEISKEDALDSGFSAMNHAMCITGVNLVDGQPNRWKIENSWGDKSGDKGYYICSDSWFDQYVFQAAVEREYLGNQAALYDAEPIELAPWDPMGTLAE